MSERFYWLSFSVFSGVGPVKFKLLLDHFGSAKEAWNASTKDLVKIGFGEVLANKFEKFRNLFSIKNYIKVLTRKGLSFTCWNENGYPNLLKKIKNPPFVLFSCGQFDFNANPLTIAVVGTRKITQYGGEVTSILTSQLVQAGFTIVSGLALGVDAVAHQAALENSGSTIAVLGSGVDQCYPSVNKRLYNSILQAKGAVISEFPPGQKPSKGSFPSRNRIIAGLSLGVLVTEGAEDSGALITANHAFQNKRKVFAVPGPITSNLSKGPYKLISRGAKLVTMVEDILSELGIQSGGIKNYELRIKRGETKEEQMIINILQNESRHFDQIAREAKMDSSRLGSLLSIMEIKGMIRSQESGFFSIAS